MIDGKFQIESGAIDQPKVLFKPGSWLTKVDFINHLVLFNNVLISVLAEKEGGKTSFAKVLEGHLDRQIKSVSIAVTAPCNSQQMISDICSELHLNHESKTDFTSVVRQINERKSHVLLIIDDAQHIAEATIKELLTEIKAQEDFGYFHLCLVSDYSVIATLNDLAQDQFNNLIHTIELGSLNESESRTYVLQRAMSLRLINKPLTDAQFKKFFQMTKGTISKINNSLEDFISRASVETQNDKHALLKKAGMTVAASVVAGLTYVYFDSHYQLPGQAETIITSLTNMETAAQADSKNLAQVSESLIAPWQESSYRELIEASLPKQQQLDQLAKQEREGRLALAETALFIPPVHAETRADEKEQRGTEIEHKAELAPAQPSTQDTSNKQPVAQVPVVVNVAAQVAKTVTEVQLGKNYTIQLAASHNQSDIHRFQEDHKLIGKTVIRQFHNDKGNWFVLTYGEFQSPSTAKLEISKLPVTLTKLKPWIRPVSGLKDLG